MAAHKKLNVDWSAIKQKLAEALLASGHEAEKISDYLQKDINELADLADYTQQVVDETVHNDYNYLAYMIWYWLGHMTDKMELVLLALEWQSRQAQMKAVGDPVEAGGRVQCCQCMAMQTFTAQDVITACSDCGGVRFVSC